MTTYLGGALPNESAVERHAGSHSPGGQDPVYDWPVGMIGMWPKALADLPSNFQACDGTNGTPDLRNFFPVGAGSTYALAASGGSTTQANHTVTQPNDHAVHNHPFNQPDDHALHSHGLTAHPNSYAVAAGATPADAGPGTGNWGPQAHSGGAVQNLLAAQVHSGTAVNAHGTNLPPYYALFFVQRMF